MYFKVNYDEVMAYNSYYFWFLKKDGIEKGVSDSQHNKEKQFPSYVSALKDAKAAIEDEETEFLVCKIDIMPMGSFVSKE